MSHEYHLPRADLPANPKKAHENVTAYINAGGRGTRLNGVLTPDPEFGIAKALLEIGSPPLILLDHHIAKMAQVAMRNVVVNAGDLEVIKDHVAAFYASDDRVAATSSPRLLGNGGDLVTAVREHPDLFAERILVTNVDTILELDEHDFLTFHDKAEAAASIALTMREGVPNERAFYVNAHGKVVYSKEASTNPRTVDEADAMTVWRGSSTGAVVIETEFVRNFAKVPATGEFSLYRHILGEAIREDAVAGYNNGLKFFLDIGTVATWSTVQDSDILNPHLSYDRKLEHI
jgi:NDP-sugar pyrophosphorylase family protein